MTPKVTRSTNTTIRKFFAVLAFIALAIAVGGMACVDTTADLDRADETDGAT